MNQVDHIVISGSESVISTHSWKDVGDFPWLESWVGGSLSEDMEGIRGRVTWNCEGKSEQVAGGE